MGSRCQPTPPGPPSLLAPNARELTVYPVYTTRARRAFTLPEVATVLVVIGILTLLGSLTLRTTETAGRDTQARNALTSFAAAQTIKHDTFGTFATTSTAAEVISTFTYVDGASASQSDTEISFTTGTSLGEAYLAAAVTSASGRCFTVKIFESASTIVDSRRFFEPGTVTCNGATAASTTGGDAW